jgi:hypothetical protein
VSGDSVTRAVKDHHAQLFKRYQTRRLLGIKIDRSHLTMILGLEIDRTLERPLGQSAAEDIMVMAEQAANGNPADIDAILICCDELEWRNERNTRAYVEIRQLMSEIHVGEVQERWHEHRVGAGPWRLHPIDWYHAVHAAAHCLSAATRRSPGCSHHLYIVLLGGFGPKEDEFGLYAARPVKNLKIGWCSTSTAIRRAV